MKIFAMKYKFLIFIFMIFTFTSSNTSKKDNQQKRHQKLSAQTVKEKIGYMQPIRLGPNSHLNLTSLLSLLKDSHLSQHHKLTGFDSAVKDSNTESDKQEDLLKIQIPDETPKEQIDVYGEQKTEDNEDEKNDDEGFFDDSSEEDEQPMMRSRDGLDRTLDDGELQYDIDEDDLRVLI